MLEIIGGALVGTVVGIIGTIVILTLLVGGRNNEP